LLGKGGGVLTRESPKPLPRKVSREAASVAPASRPAKRRLTFTDQHALETLPKTIAKLQTEIDALQAKLADSEFSARDRAAFEKVTAALGELQLKIAAAEQQWLELEIMREELASN